MLSNFFSSGVGNKDVVLEQLNLKAGKGDAVIYWIASYSLCISTWNVSSLL